jgi:hypothetical protein
LLLTVIALVLATLVGFPGNASGEWSDIRSLALVGPIVLIHMAMLR